MVGNMEGADLIISHDWIATLSYPHIGNVICKRRFPGPVYGPLGVI